jgi:hypothetical protein
MVSSILWAQTPLLDVKSAPLARQVLVLTENLGDENFKRLAEIDRDLDRSLYRREYLRFQFLQSPVMRPLVKNFYIQQTDTLGEPRDSRSHVLWVMVTFRDDESGLQIRFPDVPAVLLDKIWEGRGDLSRVWDLPMVRLTDVKPLFELLGRQALVPEKRRTSGQGKKVRAIFKAKDL